MKPEIIDTYQVKNPDGTISYVDENSFQDILDKKETSARESSRQLRDILEKIHMDNPLNKKSALFHGLGLRDCRYLGGYWYYNDCITSNGGFLLIDDFAQALKEMKQKKSNKFSLKRIVKTVGFAIGLSALVSGIHFVLKDNHKIAIETPTKDPHIEKDSQDMTQVGFKNKVKSSKGQSIKRKAKFSLIKFGDEIQLKNTKLYYDSNFHKPCVTVKKLKCDYYKINRIAVLSKDGKKIFKNIKINRNNQDLNIEEFRKSNRNLYGDDIKFQINTNGYSDGDKVYDQVGWTSISNIESKSKRKIFKKSK